jgi:leucyl-tRNA synthetase
MDNAKALQEIVAELAGKGIAKKTVKFRLNDWCISRQRYWGPPIPMIYCDKCGDQTVPEKDLPVTLPDTDNFYPDDSGKSPLARVPEFVQCKCPKCGGPARRDTDVSDNFLDSAWYFLRYPSARDNTQAFDPELTRKWLPVNMYVGGNEHACMHLMYTRFLCMALHDAGIIPFEEPFKRFRANGMIIKDGAKMSKSRGNIVTPDSFLEKYGSDTFRMYLMFLGPFTMGGDFNDKGIVGIRRFVDKVYSLQEMKLVDNETNDDITLVRHKTVKAVSNDLEELQYHTAIARLMEFMNAIRTKETIARSTMEDFLTLLAPLAPHICEEMWQWLGHKESIFNSAKWPTFDDSIIQKESIEFVVQLNSKVRAKLRVPRGLDEAAIRELAMKEEKVRDGMAGKTLKKTFFIADRLINFVVV